MAIDKVIDSVQLDADLTAVANAIRSKGGTSAQLSFPSGMAQAITDLPSGGGVATKTIDIVVDNTTSAKLALNVSDLDYDNYLVFSAVIETGVYTGGSLTIDETPTVPVGNNIDVFATNTHLNNPTTKFSGYIGTNLNNDKWLFSARGVARSSLSTYGTSTISGSKGLDKSGNTLYVGSQYKWGLAGYYFKIRNQIIAWND